MANKSSSDMQMTHTKYLEFLKSDLLLNEKWLSRTPEQQAVAISETAKAMMGRWKAFAAALEANRTDYVRLSIHDSGGKDKLSMALIPQAQRGALGATPWHSVVVAELDGSYRSVQRHTVDQQKYELIHHNGRPYFFRARSELFDWSTDGCDATFEHLYPTGLIIRPTSGAPPVTAIPMKKVSDLASTFSPVVLRGFSGATKKDVFVNHIRGTGLVLSNDATDCTKAMSSPGHEQPRYLVMAPKGNGSTLFTSSRLFFRFLPQPWSAERLEAVTRGMHDAASGNENSEQSCPVVRHPVTGGPCLRWHQTHDETTSSARNMFLQSDSTTLNKVVNAGIYDWRSCLRLSWMEGDLLVTDDLITLHNGKSNDSDQEGEFWRIHFD